MWARAVALAGGALAFIVLAVAAHQTAYLPFDPPVSHAVQSVEAPWLDTLARAVSWLGFPPQVDGVVGLLALGMFLSGRRWEAAGVVIAGAGAAVLYFAAELLVSQPRPTPDLVRVTASLPTTAFPSGHETIATAVLGFLAYLGYRRRGWSILAVAAFLLLMAWARLYQGEHWSSEVLAGVLLGGVWLWVTVRVYGWLRRRYTPTCRSSPPSA